jgi:hypothetical protein
MHCLLLRRSPHDRPAVRCIFSLLRATIGDDEEHPRALRVYQAGAGRRFCATCARRLLDRTSSDRDDDRHPFGYDRASVQKGKTVNCRVECIRLVAEVTDSGARQLPKTLCHRKVPLRVLVYVYLYSKVSPSTRR